MLDFREGWRLCFGIRVRVCCGERDMEVNNDENNLNDGEGVEIEEGEAGCYDNEEDDYDENIDLDTRFAYIGEKLDQLLGHFQKKFEGGASAENLGALCGGYGSFLPTYERPPFVLSTPKTPLGNCNRSKSPRISMEGACQNLKALSKALPTVRHGNSLPQARLSQNSRDVGAVLRTEDSCVPSTQVAVRCGLKNETSNKSGNPTDLRSLKVRIKMKSDNTPCKNVAIYSGLGLSSPSSSFGNSSDESGEVPPASLENSEESPANIIKDVASVLYQVMTSFPVPGHGLISPLHDSLLCLTRNEKLPQQKTMPQSKGSQEHPLLASVRNNGRLSLESNVEVSQAKGKGEKQVDLKTEDIKSVKTGMKFLIQKKSGTDTQGGKEPLFNGHKSIQRSNSGGDVSACAKVTQRTPDPRLTNEKEVKGRSFSKLLKPESLELMSGHGFFNKAKQEKVQKQSVKDCYKDSFLDIRDEGKNLGYKFSASVNLPGTIMKCKEEADLHPQNAGEETTHYDEEKNYGPVKKEKLSFEGKNKSKGKLIHIKQPVNLTKDNLGVEMGRKSNNKMNSGSGVSLSSGKVLKLKSQKDRLRDDRRDSLAGKVLEQRDLMDVAERPIDDYDATFKSSKDKPIRKLSGRKADNRLMSGGSFTDASATCRPTIENELASEFVPVVAAPCVIKEEWVCCDSCQKWRLLPLGKTPDQLPDEWMCSMLDWLGSGMNRCDISEDEMTKAFYASYQPPSTESLTNPLNAAHGTTYGVPLVHAQHLEQNYQNLSSNGMSNRVNKRHGVKETRNAGSGDGVLKPYLQEPVKSRGGLKDMNRQHLVPNTVKKYTGQHMSNLQDSGMEEIIVEQKEKQLRGGDANRVRLKYKKDTDQYICHTSKKPRTEDLLHADVDHGTARLTSGQSQGGKYNDLSYSEDTKDKLRVSVRKLGHKTENSLDGELLNLKMSSEGDSMKKRRHREWEDDGKVYTKEGSSESGPWREKKDRIVKKEGKEPSTSNIDDKSDRKGRVTKIVVSGTRAHSIDATKKDRSSVRNQHPMNYSKRNTSQHIFKGENVLRTALEPGHVSLASTSSSSKVSGSRRIRDDVEEVKGSSPVESVSSSPLRTSNSDRLASGKGDAFANHDRIGKNDEFLNDQHDLLHCHHNIRENKNHLEDAVLLKKTVKGSCLHSKDNSGGFAKALDRDKMKIFDPVDEYSKSQRDVAEIDSYHDFRNSLPEECSIKPVKAKGEKLHATTWDGSSVGAVGIQVKRKGYEVADGKFGATESPNRKGGTQHNLNQDFECGQKQNKFISGKPKSYSNSQNESKEGKEGVESKEWVQSSGSQAMAWPERAVLQGRSPSPTVNGSVENSLNQCGTASTKSGVSNNVEHHGARVFNASSPAISASSQIAAKILNEARSLRDKAEQSNKVPLDFFNFVVLLFWLIITTVVSSVAYFQAAQKFLQGASLLESCSNEKGKHEDMTPLQVYSMKT